MARGRRPAPGGVADQRKPVRSKREPKKALPAEAAAPVADRGPKPEASTLDPPTWLKAEALDVWNAMAPRLIGLRLLSLADVETFGRYCRNFARWLKLQAELDKDGVTYESESAHGKLKRVNPAFMAADRLERMLLAGDDRFGLNPAERQRIMMARANRPSTDDPLGVGAPAPRREGDPAASASQAAEPPKASPIGALSVH